MLLEQLQKSLGSAYTIERELGGGGMSQVFLATENRLNRKVVIKVLSPDLAAGVNAERFEREIQLAARLQQANIVPLLATGDTNGLPYFTMPFVEGESLRAHLVASGGTLSFPECVSILRDVARALSYAHATGVVHRDIKPDNVLLSHGAAMVTDFGIAKALSEARTGGHESGSLTQTGTSIGSPAYMAPEQIAGDSNIDHRADLYAFGCMGYELLTGSPPFAAQSPQRALAAHLTETPTAIESVRPDVPEDLAAIVMRCLEKDPADRPTSADEIINALNSVTTSGARQVHTARSSSVFLTGRRIRLAMILVVLLLAFGALFKKLTGRSGVSAVDKSVAVLPLTNLSGDKANDYFGEGLAEEITGALAKAGLHVVGRSSAFALSAKGMGAGEIARQLHVGNVLQGSVQRSGDQVRISVSLISGPDESVTWTERYDRPIKDVFAVQDEIARSVASQLKVKLSGETRLTHVDTQDPEAHSAYLQALYLWNRRNAPGLRKAIALFAEAVRRDPSYAQAYGGMAMAYVVMPAYDDVGNRDMLRLGRDAAARALALDSENVQALTALAYIDGLEYRNASAEKLFRRAISADSSFATAHFWHGLLLMQEMRTEEALIEIQHARALEPASLVINTAVTQVLYDMRRYDAAEAQGRAVFQLDSTFQLGVVDLAKVFIEQGKAAQAIPMLLGFIDVPGFSHLEKASVAAYALARAGKADEARSLLKKVEPLPGSQVTHRGMFAAALDAVGEREKAVEALRKAVDDNDLWLAHYLAAAPYDGLRKDPRVAQLFARVSGH